MRTLFDDIPTSNPQPAGVTLRDLLHPDKLAEWIGFDVDNTPLPYEPAGYYHSYRRPQTEDTRTRSQKATDWLRSHINKNEKAFFRVVLFMETQGIQGIHRRVPIRPGCQGRDCRRTSATRGRIEMRRRDVHAESCLIVRMRCRPC